MKKIIYFAAMLTILLLAGNVSAVESIRGLTIHVEYPDAPAWLTYSRIDNLLNGTGYIEPGAERSVREYWSDNSRGNIDVTQDIYFYTAPRKTTYYTTWQETVAMLRDCIIWFSNTHPGYDWNALSKHPDDTFISINFISSDPGVPGVGGAHSINWVAPNGVRVSRIQYCWFKNTWDPNPVNLFVYCHEQGHAMFFFPDTYDTDYSSGGTGFYSLMSGGLDTLEPVGAPFLAQEGWCSVIDAAPGTQNVTLTADGSEIARYANPDNSLEYFAIEARKKDTLGNNLFPVDVGLLIWHTDNNVSTSNTLENMTLAEHYRNSIEQADGNFDLEHKVNRGDQGDIFLPGRKFTPATTPNSNWWDGITSGLSITNIQINGDQVSFDMSVVPEPTVISPRDFIIGVDSDGNGMVRYDWGHPISELIDRNIYEKCLWTGAPNSGFIVTPSGTGAVTGFKITTADDVPGRDPTSWVLYGTDDAITSTANSTGTAENWVLIDSGTLALSDNRRQSSGLLAVNNNTAYTSYKMLFPTIKDMNQDMMQIAEFQFKGTAFTIVAQDAVEGYVYDASIADAATYSKVSGPSWLNIDPDGTLSGVPMHQNIGQNSFIVRVMDVDGIYRDAVLTVYVQNTFNGQLGLSDFANFAQHWLESDCVDFPLCSGADLTGDTNVNMADLTVLGQNWLLQGESADVLDLNSKSSGLQTVPERWEFLLK